MWKQSLFRREGIIMQLCLLALFTSAPSSKSMQTLEAVIAAREPSPREAQIIATRDPAPPKPKKTSSPPPDRLSPLATKKIASDHITSFFVRPNDSKRIQLSMLVNYRQEFTQAVRRLLNEKVTPLLFSVSTLPNRTAHFDPALLCFEQRGRIWQPSNANHSPDVWPWEEGKPFGGLVTDSQAHQGVILLPEWFDPQAPITLRYGDFRYLARLAR